MTPDPLTPSPDSPTPRVDAEVQRIENDEQEYEDRFDCWCAMIQFAKKLERENAALVKEREERARSYEEELDECDKLIVKFRAEGDIHGVNFHEGRKSGIIHGDIVQYQEKKALRATLAERDRELSGLKDNFDNIATVFEKHFGIGTELAQCPEGFGSTVDNLCKDVAALRTQLAETRKRADLLNGHNEHWVGVIRDQAAQLLALQAHVEKAHALIARASNHQIMHSIEGDTINEDLRKFAASQPGLTLIEEVRDVVEFYANSFYMDTNDGKIGLLGPKEALLEDVGAKAYKLLTRLNPRK